MKKIKVQTDNLIKGNFALCDQPIAYQISVVMRNMYGTYGKDTVDHVLKQLFIDAQPQEQKEASNE